MGNFDFSNVVAMGIDDKTAEYTIEEWTEFPKPVLVLKPTGTQNRAYFNALLAKMSGAEARRLAKGNLSIEQLDKARANMKELYPQHVVVGWRNIKDFSRAEVPFSVAACSELFKVMPDDILDGIRAFCDDPANFRQGARAEPADVEALAGNSTAA